MYQIIVKIPKENYNIAEIETIKLEAIEIMPRLGEFSVSNSSYEVLGYNLSLIHI